MARPASSRVQEVKG